MAADHRLETFLAKNPVFRTEEALRFLAPTETSDQVRRNLLHYHVRAGNILPIRHGLYASVRPGQDPGRVPVDAFLVASRCVADAVLAYHTALGLHVYAYSVTQHLAFLTAHKVRPFAFRGQRFTAVPFPRALVRRRAERFGVKHVDRLGVDVDVTGLERTLVDVLDRPDLGGGWEEVWRSLEGVPYFDLDQVVEYAALLGKATTASKVGFFLEQHRESLGVEERHLGRLRALRPKSKHYMDPPADRGSGARRPGRLVPEWSLVVPVDVIERSWEELAGLGGADREPPPMPPRPAIPSGVPKDGREALPA